jgi:tetratricopeptide (TPR) repeat protein
VRMIECESRHLIDVKLDPKNRYVQIAESYFIRALKGKKKKNIFYFLFIFYFFLFFYFFFFYLFLFIFIFNFYFLLAAPKDSNVLFQYGRFLDKCGASEKAEEYYLKSLESDPNNDSCLHEYGNFLHERGIFEMAEKFYLRCSNINNVDEKDTKKRKLNNIEIENNNEDSKEKLEKKSKVTWNQFYSFGNEK